MLLVIVEESDIHAVRRRPDESRGRLVSRVTLNRAECYTFVRHRKQVEIVVHGAGQLTPLWIICQATAVQDHAAADNRRQEAAFAFGYAARTLVGLFPKN